MNTAKKQSTKGITQFELTTNLLRNLNKYKLTPVAKLVLLELTTHYNDVNGVVFPSMNYIAEVLGVGLTSVKQAINDLIKEGLIIKSKRDKVKGNCNKYVLTLKVQNTTSDKSEIERFKQSKSDLSYIRTNNEKKINNNYFFKNFQEGYKMYPSSKESEKILEQNEDWKNTRESYTQCQAWLELGKKLKAMKTTSSV